MKRNSIKLMKNNDSLANKLLKYFSVFSIVPITFFTILFCTLLAFYSTNQLKLDSQININQLSIEIDLLLEEAYQTGNSIKQNSKVNEILNLKFNSIEQIYYYETLLSSELSQILEYSDDNIDVYILGENGGQYKSGNKQLKYIIHKEEWWYKEILESDDEIWYYPHKDSFVTKTLGEDYISLGIPIEQAVSGRIIGVVLVEIRLNAELFSIIDPDKYLFYIVDENNTIVITQEKSKLYENIYDLPVHIYNSRENIKYWEKPNDINNSYMMDDNNQVTIYKFSKMNDWIYSGIITKRQTYVNISIIVFALFIAMISLMAILYNTSYKISKSLTNPIIELIDTMSLIQQGDFGARIDNPAKDEIGQLGRSFNKMVLDINRLMNRIIEEQNKIKQYEFMLLQAQINPHFLYNTLDSIIWLIRMKDQENSIKMIHALTMFIRTGLSNGKDVISLQNEIENISSYLTIQQLRYNNKLSYEIDFPDDIMTQMIPKLTLQPLIENAIYHGIKNKIEGGFIHIYGYSDGNDLVIIVADDGIGMDFEVLNRLRSAMGDDESTSDSFGYRNVRDRLDLYYKGKCSINIESQIDMGTTITIRINNECKI